MGWIPDPIPGKQEWGGSLIPSQGTPGKQEWSGSPIPSQGVPGKQEWGGSLTRCRFPAGADHGAGAGSAGAERGLLEFLRGLQDLPTNSKAFTAKTSCVRRRYREFVWLRRQLQRNAGLVPVPELPGKSAFFVGSTDEFIERRRQGLQHFLESCASLGSAQGCLESFPYWSDFGMDEARPESPERPAGHGVTPLESPEFPAGHGVTPLESPEFPAGHGVTPLESPEFPAGHGVTPLESPEFPAGHGVTPLESPEFPAGHGVTPLESPEFPAGHGVTPLESPEFPAGHGVTPLESPEFPAGHGVTPLESPEFPAGH
ncbi:sorting nexin-11 isoform X3 [Serinus canaria]|uniref:sorting nexin-11 isoform X3 n=1 Tax=Serinus canaria TaxID=9135 RepID=UPI0021CCEF11|nr:sorting nexin-11 isoform X3 [Serinus canaria]